MGRFLDLVIVIVSLLCGFYGEINASRTDEPRRTTASVKQAELLKSLDNYDIVHPYITDQNGNHVTSDLREIHSPRRYRRELSSRGESDLPLTLYMAVNVSRNDRLRLNLTHRPDFLSKGFLIERRGRNISQSELTRPTKLHRCQYRGHVVGNTSATVALSVCQGLRGMIWSSQDEYFIEPVAGHVTKTTRNHPHVIYKRSALPSENVMYADAKRQMEDGVTRSSGATCGVDDDGYESEAVTDEELEVEGHHRSRRSISQENFVETLVVVDHNMYDYYHDQDVETYVLAIMNMVTSLYHDASLGNLVNIALVRLLILTEPEEGLNISHHADNSLKSFCSWQQDLNAGLGGDGHPSHHDTALLFTRKDICSRMDEPCSTLGLAYTSGMCQPHRSCTINEDSGLGMAYTVAHEMGHLFGISHDGIRYRNDCENPEPGTSQIMGAQLIHRGPMKWSRCSKAYISRFLDRGWGDCLQDEPTPHEFNFPKVPAGVMYTADYQCELLFKRNSTVCRQSNVEMSMCSTLWCQVGNSCNSRTVPAAPGTECGENKWCLNDECVTIDQPPPPIPGGWGQWSEWTECSRTCGGGVSIQERHCDNPAPANGGRYCEGKRKNYALCNVQPCPEGSVGFREQQCSRYNRVQHSNLRFDWIPFIDKAKECHLICRQRHSYYLVEKAATVVDGTSCGKDMKDVCINGICYKVGCDQRVGSSAVEDICGVCHGDGSSCKQINEEFNNTVDPGHIKITVIPTGARSISVEEKDESLRYIDLQNEDGISIFRSYELDMDGEYQIDIGIISGVYVRNGSREKLTVKGPLPEPIYIFGDIRTRNPSIGYRYYLPKPENETTPRPARFEWQYDEWTPCSTTCGNGTQRAIVRCVRFLEGVVDDVYCNDTKPDDDQRSCNEHSCPASWWMGPWTQCSATCGEGYMKRSVFCIKSLSHDEQMAVSEQACINHGAGTKPATHKDCNNFDCPSEADWQVGNWSDCSATCGEGVQRRDVECGRPDNRCAFGHRPQTERPCESPCQHDYSSYLEGSDYYSMASSSVINLVNTYGGWEERENDRKQRRKHRNRSSSKNAKIDSDSVMFEELQHDGERNNLMSGTNAFLDSKTSTLKEWTTDEWSQCSVSCGSGTRSRLVSCVVAGTTTQTYGCSPYDRPLSAEICHRDVCPADLEGCSDSLDAMFCRIARQSGSCTLPQFKRVCCETCK